MNIDHYTDQDIVEAILRRDAPVTREFLYRKCMPLFRAIHAKYYTDCQTPIELINQIYLYILTPSSQTGRCKLEGFGHRCTLTMWLKVVTEHYCHQLFAKKIDANENFSVDSDRNSWEGHSLDSDLNNLDMDDLQRILQMMPNERYRQLIQYRYLDDRTNEETAMLLALSMSNYYNAHLRAKAQFCAALRHEGLI